MANITIKTYTEYAEMVRLLDSLIDKVGQDETHPLAELLHQVGEVIYEFERNG